MKTIEHLFLLTAAGTLLLTSCKKDPDPVKKEETPAPYTVPTKYDSASAKYADQTTMVLLLDSLSKLINSAKKNKITKSKLQDLFENKDVLFTTNTIEIPSLKKQLSDLGQTLLISKIESLFDSVETHSPMAANIGTKTYFITPSGLDVAQIVQKTLMGAIYYNRIVNDEMVEVKSKTNITDMLHEWDEAFGYYGAPRDFNLYTSADIAKKYRDNNGDGKQNIPLEKYYLLANYSLTLDEKLKAFPSDNLNFRSTLMDAFLKGRAAILNNDNAARDASIVIIRETLEKQIAASVLSYINATKRNLLKPVFGDQSIPAYFDDRDSKSHEWAEGRGFLNSLQYKDDKKITNDVWMQISALYGEDGVSETSVAKLDEAAKKLQAVYSFSNTQRDNY